jgi:predicted negative regulator of RcsB-dependent stress response
MPGFSHQQLTDERGSGRNGRAVNAFSPFSVELKQMLTCRSFPIDETPECSKTLSVKALCFQRLLEGAGCAIFHLHINSVARKDIVGTTKLTRKEILAEDPVHEAIIQLIEFFKLNGKNIGLIAAAVVLVGVGVYGGIQYLANREAQAQELLGKGMELFHAQIAPDASDDPYAKGPNPVFKTEVAKYRAAAKEFSSLVSKYSYSKTAVVARYYLGLAQMQLGQAREAAQNLESVAGNSKDRTVRFLAKKALANAYLGLTNYKAAQELLEGMIKDAQCTLPKEDMTIQLSRVLVAQGKRDEAIKVLRDAGAQGEAFSALKQQVTQELDRLQKATTGQGPSSVRP